MKRAPERSPACLADMGQAMRVFSPEEQVLLASSIECHI